MTRRRLTNDAWGVDSCCYVCEASNDEGLRLAFWADDERSVVEADLSLPIAYSGAPAVVHGGLSLAVLDEAQAWATIAFGGWFAVTTETGARFHQPVWVDHEHRVEGWITSHNGDTFTTAGRIVDARGTECVTATATFLAIGEATPEALARDIDAGEERQRRFLGGN